MFVIFAHTIPSLLNQHQFFV